MSSPLRWFSRLRCCLRAFVVAACWAVLSFSSSDYLRAAEETIEDAPATEKALAEPVAPIEAQAGANEDSQLSFNFRYQPWQDVLDWFAEQADERLPTSPLCDRASYRSSHRQPWPPPG